MEFNLIRVVVVLFIFGIIIYSITLPLIRRRPIIVSNKILLILVTSIGLSALLSSYLLFTTIAVLLILCLLYTRLWFIIGITDEDLTTALDRTIKGTLARAQLNPATLKVDFIQPVGTMNFYHQLPFNIKTCTSHLPSSPKNKLFQSVLKKLIDNYYIHI